MGRERPWQSAEFWRAVERETRALEPLEWTAFQELPVELSPERREVLWERLCARLCLTP